MLDVRYYRESWHVRRNATVLGKEQEDWLVAELGHKERFTVVCSGSCLTEGTEKLEFYETFYPWICSLLKQKGRALFLCGDVHENKFVEHDGFFEVISSGAGRDNLNNYGILQYLDGRVRVSLRGERRPGDNIERTIDQESWRLI
jgi:hypothetical protein